MHRYGRARRGAAGGAGQRLYRLRLHRRQPACRQPRADHDSPALAAARAPAGRADGRRDDADRRSVRPRRHAPAPERRADRRQHGRNPPLLHAVPALRRGGVGRDDGEQRRVARPTRLYRAAARGRAAFQRQPDADIRQHPSAARAGTAADLPRIQLHDFAELRFPRAAPSARRRAADGRVGPVGQHRRRRRSWCAAPTRRACSG